MLITECYLLGLQFHFFDRASEYPFINFIKVLHLPYFLNPICELCLDGKYYCIFYIPNLLIKSFSRDFIDNLLYVLLLHVLLLYVLLLHVLLFTHVILCIYVLSIINISIYIILLIILSIILLISLSIM